MEQNNETSLSPVNVNEDDLLELKAKFPILQIMKHEDENFLKLAQLLKEMAITNYNPDRKYELMYKIVKIGNLMELLCPEITNESSSEIVKSCPDGIDLNKLDLSQQLAFFQVARDASADYFHALYENKVSALCESFSQLCKGKSNKDSMISIYTSCNVISNGKTLKKLLNEGGGVGLLRIDKLFCQIGYFLKKAADLTAKGELDGACLALIAAGSCSRAFNRTGLNPVKSGSITALLTDIRAKLSHTYINEYNDAKRIELLKNTLTTENVDSYIQKLKTESKNITNKELDVDTYYTSKEESTSVPESPRAYERSVFKL